MLYGVRLAQLGIPANTNQIYQHNELALGIHEVILSSLLLSTVMSSDRIGCKASKLPVLRNFCFMTSVL